MSASESGKKTLLRFVHTDGEYEFVGFNPKHHDRVIIRSLDGALVGTVSKENCRPVGKTWEEIEAQRQSSDTFGRERQP